MQTVSFELVRGGASLRSQEVVETIYAVLDALFAMPESGQLASLPDSATAWPKVRFHYAVETSLRPA